MMPDNEPTPYETFSQWLADHPEPNVQDLVERYGGYSKVPIEAWADFDRRMAEWREAYKNRHNDLTQAVMQTFKRLFG
jgi:hypothetical protein